MKQHLQTIVACPDTADGVWPDGSVGDCFRTALACLLGEHDVLDVPHFGADEDWWMLYRELMWKQDADLIYLRLPIEDSEWQRFLDELAPEFVMLDGPSPRGPWSHVVIGTYPDLTFVHDPHPSQAGLTEVDGIFVVVPHSPLSWRVPNWREFPRVREEEKVL